MGGWFDLIENNDLSQQLNSLPVQVINFAFDENVVLWPESNCLNGWVNGFIENLAIPAPN